MSSVNQQQHQQQQLQLQEKQLLTKMKYLLHTKRKILNRKSEIISSSDKSESDHFPVLNENKSPLTTDVYFLELKQQEMDKNLRHRQKDKERQVMRKQIEIAVCEDEEKPLLKWYREMKSCSNEQQGESLESDQYFISPTYDIIDGREELKFSSCYKGFVLFIEISHDQNTECDSQLLSIKSDIYLHGLKNLLTTSIEEKKSSKDFVSRVWDELENEVIQCL